ncbi:hypothetical protein G3576_13275 [Roseomonas stagni]|uniref:Immunity MXAN-0049 protein domain-containing protein n=1 Tax=Falsiroseomonas algicola TaxID=2716930 RepID=A0A6M1LLV0_9PROT|nr:DUF1629 domain-containing protein [Falsiroseomonas algicola]NGM20989.1 hypothetical protein [Falsiroseomonas algicola]
MSIAKDAYEELCRARDALDAGPDEGEERGELFRRYLKTRITQYNRAESVRPVIDPVPAMNRRFFVMQRRVTSQVVFAPGEASPAYDAGDGRGWEPMRSRPAPRLMLGPGLSFRRMTTVLDCPCYYGTHILPRSLLDIWLRFDAAALDVLPIHLEGRRKQPAPQDYFYVDIIRRLPAFDLDAMGVFLFRQPKPYANSVEIFPTPRAFALRDDLPVDGVHLFRDANWRETYFVSTQLHQACLDAGFTDLPLAAPEAPER